MPGEGCSNHQLMAAGTADGAHPRRALLRPHGAARLLGQVAGGRRVGLHLAQLSLGPERDHSLGAGRHKAQVATDHALQPRGATLQSRTCAERQVCQSMSRAQGWAMTGAQACLAVGGQLLSLPDVSQLTVKLADCRQTPGIPPQVRMDAGRSRWAAAATGREPPSSWT